MNQVRSRSTQRRQGRPADDSVKVKKFDVGEKIEQLITFLEEGLITVEGQVLDTKSRKMVRGDVSQRILGELEECLNRSEYHFWRSTFQSWKSHELQARSTDSKNPACSQATRAANIYLKTMLIETDQHIRESR